MMVQRTRNLFDPASREFYNFSRSKLELFLQCPRCLYLDRRRGIGQPAGPLFSLNIAVDILLKKEFDLCRYRGEPHAVMRQYGIDALPLVHPALDEWRDPMRGIRYVHPQTGFCVFGAVDDLWVNPAGQLLVVDYKATSTDRPITLDGWKQSYKRQIEIYQWLLRKKGYDVSLLGYLVFVNADRGREAFDGKLECTTTVISFIGSDAWIEDALQEAKICLCRDMPPQPNPSCEWCAYRQAAQRVENWC